MSESTLENLESLSHDIESQEAEAVALEEAIDNQIEGETLTEADKEAAKVGAMMAVGFLEQVVKMRLPMVEYSDDQKKQLGDKIEPVMMKYQTGLPEWLQPYKEEIELGICLGTMGFTTYLQVKAWEAEQQRQLKEQEKEAA